MHLPPKLQNWLVPALLLGTAVYAIAEEITLTTYYPSPRGVYNELRTSGNVQIGNIIQPGGSGGPPDPAPRLYIDGDVHATNDVCTDIPGEAKKCLSSIGARSWQASVPGAYAVPSSSAWIDYPLSLAPSLTRPGEVFLSFAASPCIASDQDIGADITFQMTVDAQPVSSTSLFRMSLYTSVLLQKTVTLDPGVHTVKVQTKSSHGGNCPAATGTRAGYPGGTTATLIAVALRE